MVTVQQAYQYAVEYAREMLGNLDFTLEEVERGDYRNQDAWLITLGFTKRGLPKPLEEMMAASLREYKMFVINTQTGEPLAMKIRELTA